MIQLFNIKPERVTVVGYTKLIPSEVIDVKFGRSNYQFMQSISLSINNEQDETSLPRSVNKPSLIEFKCGRSIIYSFILFRYLIILLIKKRRMHYYLM